MQEITHIRQIMAEADCLVDEAAVEAAVDTVAEAITATLGESNPIVLCVMKGGLIFCSKLLERLQFPLELDYLHVTRYQNGVHGTDDIEWRARPSTDVSGRSVLLVDDILDVGSTLKSILDSPELAVAEGVYTAVLMEKAHDRKADPDFKADFTGLVVEDRYLFGYGMDYKGYLRNAPGIYAVKGL